MDERRVDMVSAFVVGLTIGVASFSILLKNADSSVSRHDKVIAECEKSLPRDQQCKVAGFTTAHFLCVPVIKDEK